MPYKRKAPGAYIGNKRYKRRKVTPRGKPRSVSALSRRVSALSRTIEQKEGQFKVVNFALAHNQLTVLNRSDGFVLNPFQSNNDSDDPMVANTMNRIGDEISVKRVTLTLFLETSSGRSNVHFRIFFVKMAKGDTLNRANFFKDCASNKMIDQVNTERFTVLASKTVRITPPNTPGSGAVGLTGLLATTGTPIGGTRVVRMSIPGRKFGRNGVVRFENKSTQQVKFYDYRVAIVAYDWYGTPQDVNTLGIVNEGFVKTYFKDA